MKVSEVRKLIANLEDDVEVTFYVVPNATEFNEFGVSPDENSVVLGPNRYKSVVVPSTRNVPRCKGCDLLMFDCEHIPCNPGGRKDGTKVIFKQVR